jgi:hypothetical protein
MGYIEQLITNCGSAQGAEPTDVIHYRDLTRDMDSELDEVLSDIKKRKIVNAIYIIREVGGNKNTTFEYMKSFKAKKERKLPRVNKASDIMYVGSSIKPLYTRIRQHLGRGGASTYALNIKHWFSGTFEIEIQVYNVERPVLQIIEDSISYKLKPAFGKMGSN